MCDCDSDCDSYDFPKFELADMSDLEFKGLPDPNPFDPEVEDLLYVQENVNIFQCEYYRCHNTTTTEEIYCSHHKQMVTKLD